MLDDLDAVLLEFANVSRTVGESVGFIFDFDGTLAPIVETPSEARMHPLFVPLLRRIISSYDLAIVSGRPIDFLLEQFKFLASQTSNFRVRLFGHYGFESSDLEGLSIERRVIPAGELGELEEFRNRWKRMSFPEVAFEDKGVSFGLHYRGAPQIRQPLGAWISQELAQLQGLIIRPGKMVFEVAPASMPSKEVVVNELLSFTPRVVFSGDDYGDLGVFRLLRLDNYSKRCLSILVANSSETPDELAETCDLKTQSPGELALVIDRLLGLLDQS